MPQRRHSDPLFDFSYSVFKLEYIIIKLVLLGLSLFGLYKLIEAETGFSFHPQEQSPPNKKSASPFQAIPALPSGTETSVRRHSDPLTKFSSPTLVPVSLLLLAHSRAIALVYMAYIDTRTAVPAEVLEKLNLIWRKKICAACGHDSWSAEAQLAELRPLSTFGFVVGGPVVPLVVVTCQTCGNTMLFNALKLGWSLPTGIGTPEPIGGGR